MTYQPQPFVRRCICPEPPASVEDHTPACNLNYLSEFKQAVADFRRDRGGQPHG